MEFYVINIYKGLYPELSTNSKQVQTQIVKIVWWMRNGLI